MLLSVNLIIRSFGVKSSTPVQDLRSNVENGESFRYHRNHGSHGRLWYTYIIYIIHILTNTCDHKIQHVILPQKNYHVRFSAPFRLSHSLVILWIWRVPPPCAGKWQHCVDSVDVFSANIKGVELSQSNLQTLTKPLFFFIHVHALYPQQFVVFACKFKTLCISAEYTFCF